MPSSIDLAARLSAIVAMQAEILHAVTDPDAVMQLVISRTAELTGGTGAVIEMVEGEELVYRAASGTALAHVGTRLPRSKSLSGLVVREQQVIRCDDTELDARVDGAACRAIGIRSMIIAPLVEGREAVGALKTYSSSPRAFDDLDGYTLQLLAGITSAALMRAQEFRERQASEERYRLLFERNVAGVFRTTLDGRILDCNTAMAESLGYTSREDLLAHQSWDLYPQRGDRESFIANLQRDRAMTNVRLQLRRKDGSDMPTLVNASIVPAEGGELHVLGTMVEA